MIDQPRNPEPNADERKEPVAEVVDEIVEEVAEAVSAAVEPSPTVEVQGQKKLARYERHKFEPDDGESNIALSGELKLRYVTLRQLTYKHTIIQPIVIRKGFKTDLASIPPILWWLPGLDPVDPRWRVAICHDWLYQEQTTERSVCDILFRSGLMQDGVNPFVAWCAWLVVRLVGWIRWRQVERQWEAEQAAKAAEEKR